MWLQASLAGSSPAEFAAGANFCSHCFQQRCRPAALLAVQQDGPFSMPGCTHSSTMLTWLHVWASLRVHVVFTAQWTCLQAAAPHQPQHQVAAHPTAGDPSHARFR